MNADNGGKVKTMRYNGLRVSTTKNVIEMTKTFKKKAEIYGSDEYLALQDAREHHPNYLTRVMKTNRRPSPNKGLDFAEMSGYIESRKDAERWRSELERARKDKRPIGEVVSWFRRTFPEYKGILEISSPESSPAISEA